MVSDRYSLFRLIGLEQGTPQHKGWSRGRPSLKGLNRNVGRYNILNYNLE